MSDVNETEPTHEPTAADIAAILREYKVGIHPKEPRRALWDAARDYYLAKYPDATDYVSERALIAWCRHHRGNAHAIEDELKAAGASADVLREARLWMTCRLIRVLRCEIDPHVVLYDRVTARELELELSDKYLLA